MKSNLVQKLIATTCEHKPEILIGTGIAGMITSTVLAVAATPKAIDLCEELKADLGVTKLTKKEVVKSTWKCYVPSAALGVVSAGCIIAGTKSSLSKTAAMTTAYALSERTLKTYQDKIVEVCGEEKATEVRKEVKKAQFRERPVIVDANLNPYVTVTGNGDSLFFDSLSGRYFKSSMNAIERAVNIINKKMISEDYVTLNDLYGEIGLPTVEVGCMLGWSVNWNMIETVYDTYLCEDGTPYVLVDFRNNPRPIKSSVY